MSYKDPKQVQIAGHISSKDNELISVKVQNTVPNKFSVPNEVTFIAVKVLHPMNLLLQCNISRMKED